MKLTRRFLAPVSLAALLAALLVVSRSGLPPWAQASHTTFVVNTTADDPDASPGDGTCATAGAVCTLRAAIQEANAHAGTDSIHFTFSPIHIGQTGNGPLPSITETVTINGNSGGLTRVELDGTQADPPGVDGPGYGLRINAPNSTVSGVVINRFGAGGVIFGTGSDGSTLRNSFIGTDSSGTADLGNGGNSGFTYEGGVVVLASGITIGGTSDGDRNVISGNNVGVLIAPVFPAIVDTTIVGNYIGTDVSGTADLGNDGPGIWMQAADDTVIGGASAGARNVISGNGTGIHLDLSETGPQFSDRTAISGNYIGTDVNGVADLGNSGRGIWIQGGVDTVIGGASAGARNIISGNGTTGIHLDDCFPDSCVVQRTTIAGNYIGTNGSGLGPISNGAEGVDLDRSDFSCVGGIIVDSDCTPTAGAGNVISGNIGTGIKAPAASGAGFGQTIVGNYIGINAAGTASLANSGNGIDAAGYGATIGGTSALARNVISGNGLNGVRMARSTGGPAEIQGNYIGLNAAGTQAIGNLQDGIHIELLPNCIGGHWNTVDCVPIAGGGNVISGNVSDGIEFAPGSNDSWVQDNLIGINAAQTVGIGNAGHGVYINDSIDNRIGGTTGGNTIFANGLDGVRVAGAAAGGNSIRGNSIWANGGKGIENINGGNAEPGHAPPLITTGDFSGASGTSCANCTIDIYSDNTEDEGRVYHGSAVADGAGTWSFSGAIIGPKLTATATNAAGSTSEFGSFAGNPQAGPEFTVNSTGPENDGFCADAFGDCTIREAINAANADGMGSIVQLGNAQTYSLTGVDNAGNGLPEITTEVGIFGNGSTITRQNGAPLFRIFQVPAGGILLLDNVTVSGGEATGATGDGGGIFVNGGQLHMFYSTVTGNRAAMGTTGMNGGPGGHGGGIAISNGGIAVIMESTINGNIAGTGGLGTELNSGAGGNGGGIALLGGTLNMERSLVNVNFAGGGRFSATGSGGGGGWGGGIHLAGGSTANISNTTIRANRAGGGAVGATFNGNGGNGGGIAALSTITSLTNLTFSDNNVGPAGGAGAVNGNGSGIYGDGNAITARNTIMANGAGGNCGTASAPGFGSASNLATDATCGASFTQKTLAQINFGTFGNNGGPTSTLPLLPGSHAIDNGNNSHCENPPVSNSDQRGVQRPFDGDANGTAICDIGAFEYCPDTDSDARCNGQDNCPSTANWDQADFDFDGAGDACDSEDDGDGFTDEVESGTPLCSNASNDDNFDDAVANDGCPGGPAQAGTFSEAQFNIGTNSLYPCGFNSWPADLWDQPPFSANKVNVQDLTSFLAPTYRLYTSPGDANFSSRWDLIPGKGIFSWFINIQDLTAIVLLEPPMLNGVRAYAGPSCPLPSQ